MKKNIKTIVLVHNVEFPQQGAIDIFYYAKYLSQYPDIKVKVIVAKVNESISYDNLEIIELGKINYFLFVRKAFWRIKKIKKEGSLDYVYFFAQHPFSILLQFLIKYVLRIKNIYDVVSGPIGHGIISKISKLTIQLGVGLADRYVVLDQGLIQKLHLSKTKRHEIIGMGYDSDIFYPKEDPQLLRQSPEDIIFTYIGTLDSTRNLEIVVQAFLHNLQEFPEIKLYIIGTGNGEEKIRSCAGNQLNKSIILLGKQPHHTIPDYIASSDILISYVPKVDYYEYQPPTKLIEYLACNKPVMATNTIAQEKILIGYEFLIHKDNLEDTTRQIRYCREHIDELRQKNYNGLVEQYSWKKLVGRLRKLIS